MVRAGVLACVGAALLGAPAWAQPRVSVDGAVTALAFSSDGEWLAVGHAPAGGAGAVTLYAMKKRGEPVPMPGLGKPTTFVGFAGDQLAASDGHTLVVWNFAFAKENFRLDLSKRRAAAAGGLRVLADPRGPRVAVVAVGAGGEGTVEVFDIGANRVITAISKVRAGAQAAWSADGGWLLLDGAAWAWDDLRSWKPKNPGVAAAGAGGKLLAYVDPGACADGVTLIDPAGRKVLRTVTPDKDKCPLSLWLIDGGRALLWVGGAAGATAMYRWDADRDKVRTVHRDVAHHPMSVLSPDEKLLAIPAGSKVVFETTR
jgi:hypothetical protein